LQKQQGSKGLGVFPAIWMINLLCPSQERGLTLILLTWRIWWSPNIVSRWQMKFNSVFKGLIQTVTLVVKNEKSGVKLYGMVDTEANIFSCFSH